MSGFVFSFGNETKPTTRYKKGDREDPRNYRPIRHVQLVYSKLSPVRRNMNTKETSQQSPAHSHTRLKEGLRDAKAQLSTPRGHIMLATSARTSGKRSRAVHPRR
eukprot:6977889-Prymnesium_polylepis.1